MDINERIKLEAELASYSGNDKIVSSIEMKDTLRERLNTIPSVSMRSNIPAIDRHIHSFVGGELTVISGTTGNGKTLFAQTLTKEFSDQGKYCLWFTYEVAALQFLEQFTEPVPPFLMPGELASSSMEWITKRIWEAKLKFGLDAVFIDHLHFLIDMSNRGNISLEIGSVMRALKKIALRFNIAVFLLAHTQKLELDREPELDALRDSGMIACESDNVFFVWRILNTDNRAIFKIAKNRRFGVMGKKVHLQKIGKYLREVYDI